MTRRLGLFGGSFDPVHAGHLALARTALAHLQLDELRWVPVGRPWQKAGQLADAEHRAAMVRLALQGEPGHVLDRSEIDRPGPSYTLDTVRALQAAHPGARWFLLLGQDQHANLPSWHGWQELLQRVELAVAARPLPTLDAAQPQAPAASPSPLANARVHWLPMPLQPVSATAVRRRLAEGEAPQSLAPNLLTAPVADYIARHRLYTCTAPTLH
jgi:nicotinate-nucleotide adenylyltransferase